MPLEGQWKRQTTSLRKLQSRERRILISVVVVLVVMCVAIVAASISTGGAKAAPPGCVRITLAGVMGAAVQQPCGERAKQLCAHPGGQGGPPYVKLVRVACREAGLPTTP